MGFFVCCEVDQFVGNKEREKKMEPFNQKSLERVVSQRALQMGNSFPCQICVVGFLLGVCLTYFALAALTSLATFELAAIPFSTFSTGALPPNSSLDVISE